MPHGVETLSFDLFGLARRLERPRDKPPQVAEKKKPSLASHEDDTDGEDVRRHEIFFWGMFPIL